MKRERKQVTFKVFRFDPEKDRKPYFKKYTVPVGEKVLTVLDGLFYIQQELDESIEFNYSCRKGICGSCSMHINGKDRRACVTSIASLKRRKVVIKPLSGHEIKSDLIVDLSPFLKKYDVVTFKIFRFDPEKDKRPYFKEYTVPMGRKVLTVLDGLCYIQQELDGSIAFRSSCRAAVCGSCAMHINGKYRLACNTHIATLNSQKVVIRPLGHLEIKRDLVVDFEPFWEKYELIKPYLMPGSPPPDKEWIQSPDEKSRTDILIDCILCACCYASCTLTLTDKNYLGPAALLQANRFVQDSRDGETKERLLIVNGHDGAWRCHTMFNCQVVCPKSLNPSGSIADLKRKLVALNL